MIRFGADHEFEKAPLRRGTWSAEEDQILTAHINKHGIGNWNEMPNATGLLRTGKSCRLRWMNYLRPGIKRGKFSEEEEKTILNLHEKLGNCWSKIAAELPGRTDNEIKNYWYTHLEKRMRREAVQSTKARGTQASNSSKKLFSKKETPLLPIILESSGSGSSKELSMAPLEPSLVVLWPMSINPTGEMNRNHSTMEEKNPEEIYLGIPFEDQLSNMEDQTYWFEEFFFPCTGSKELPMPLEPSTANFVSSKSDNPGETVTGIYLTQEGKETIGLLSEECFSRGECQSPYVQQFSVEWLCALENNIIDSAMSSNRVSYGLEECFYPYTSLDGTDDYVTVDLFNHDGNIAGRTI